jgi:hypothetical protein
MNPYPGFLKVPPPVDIGLSSIFGDSVSDAEEEQRNRFIMEAPPAIQFNNVRVGQGGYEDKGPDSLPAAPRKHQRHFKHQLSVQVVDIWKGFVFHGKTPRIGDFVAIRPGKYVNADVPNAPFMFACVLDMEQVNQGLIGVQWHEAKEVIEDDSKQEYVVLQKIKRATGQDWTNVIPTSHVLQCLDPIVDFTKEPFEGPVLLFPFHELIRIAENMNPVYT